MLNKQIESWDKLAQEDPFWAVLTADDKRHQRWNQEDFFATGENDVAALFDRLTKMGLGVDQERALDFGCGLGRLSRALASRFHWVDGLDISRVMVTKAANLSKEANIRFIHNPASDLSQLRSGEYSFILSLITLQHMPAKMAAGYIADMCRLLRPGGIAYLQLSTFLNVRDELALAKLTRDESALNLAYRAIRNLFRPRLLRMDTDYCRLSKVLDILERRRMRIVAVLPDTSMPKPFVSHIVIFENPIR